MAAKLGEILVRKGLVTQEVVDETLEAQALSGGRLGSLLVEMGHLDARLLGLTLAEQRRFPLAEQQQLMAAPSTSALRIDHALAMKNEAYPFAQSDRALKVAFAAPYEQAAVEAIALATGKRVEAYIAPETWLKAALAKRYQTAAAAHPVEDDAGDDPIDLEEEAEEPAKPEFRKLGKNEFLSGDDDDPAAMKGVGAAAYLAKAAAKPAAAPASAPGRPGSGPKSPPVLTPASPTAAAPSRPSGSGPKAPPVLTPAVPLAAAPGSPTRPSGSGPKAPPVLTPAVPLAAAPGSPTRPSGSGPKAPPVLTPAVPLAAAAPTTRPSGPKIAPPALAAAPLPSTAPAAPPALAAAPLPPTAPAAPPPLAAAPPPPTAPIPPAASASARPSGPKLTAPTPARASGPKPGLAAVQTSAVPSSGPGAAGPVPPPSPAPPLRPPQPAPLPPVSAAIALEVAATVAPSARSAPPPASSRITAADAPPVAVPTPFPFLPLSGSGTPPPIPTPPPAPPAATRNGSAPSKARGPTKAKAALDEIDAVLGELPSEQTPTPTPTPTDPTPPAGAEATQVAEGEKTAPGAGAPKGWPHEEEEATQPSAAPAKLDETPAPEATEAPAAEATEAPAVAAAEARRPKAIELETSGSESVPLMSQWDFMMGEAAAEPTTPGTAEPEERLVLANAWEYVGYQGDAADEVRQSQEAEPTVPVAKPATTAEPDPNDPVEISLEAIKSATQPPMIVEAVMEYFQRTSTRAFGFVVHYGVAVLWRAYGPGADGAIVALRPDLKEPSMFKTAAETGKPIILTAPQTPIDEAFFWAVEPPALGFAVAAPVIVRGSPTEIYCIVGADPAPPDGLVRTLERLAKGAAEAHAKLSERK